MSICKRCGKNESAENDRYCGPCRGKFSAETKRRKELKQMAKASALARVQQASESLSVSLLKARSTEGDEQAAWIDNIEREFESILKTALGMMEWTPNLD